MMKEGDVYKAVVNITLPFSVQARNVYKARYMLPQGDDADALSSFYGYIAQMYSVLPPYISKLVSVDSFDLYNCGRCGYLPLAVQPHIGHRVLNIQGTRMDDPLPHQVAALISAVTGVGRGVAKKFLPGFTEEFHALGGWTLSLLTALGQFAAYYITPFGVETGDEWHPVVYNARGECAPLVEAIVRPLASTWRKRKPGVGI